MTVFTRPAFRLDRDAGPGSGPSPWPGMLWVTWRQHRGLLVSVLVVFAAAVASMLVYGQRIHHDYAILRACRSAASPACQGLSNYFNSTDWHLANYLQVALLAAPVLLAMFAGPPVVARDLENGTYRYAWTQGIGRVRWTVAKIAILGAVVTIAALVISELFAWLFAPFLTTEKLTVYTPSVFVTHGICYPAWTLTAFCLGAFFGALVRRVLPAMAITPVVYAGLAALTWFSLRPHYPVRTFWPMQLFEAGAMVGNAVGHLAPAPRPADRRLGRVLRGGGRPGGHRAENPPRLRAADRVPPGGLARLPGTEHLLQQHRLA
jgi:hypothetical protein